MAEMTQMIAMVDSRRLVTPAARKRLQNIQTIVALASTERATDAWKNAKILAIALDLYWSMRTNMRTL